MITLAKTVLQNCEHAIKVRMPEDGHNSHQWKFHCSNVYTVGDNPACNILAPAITNGTLGDIRGPFVTWNLSLSQF